MLFAKQARQRHGSTGLLIALVLSSALCGCQPKVADLPPPQPESETPPPTAEAPAPDFISPELPAPPSRPSVPEHITPTPAPRAMSRSYSGVWIVDVESGQKQFVSDGYMPLWSPDGSWLAFNSWERDGRGLGVSVWDGERVRVVARTEGGPSPFAWTSDSRHVVVHRPPARDGGKPNLVPVSVADGRQGEPLGPGRILGGWPHWPHSPFEEGVCLGLRGQRYVWTVDDSAVLMAMDSRIEAAKEIVARAKMDPAEAKLLVAALGRVRELTARSLEREHQEAAEGDDELAEEYFGALLGFAHGVASQKEAGTLTDAQAEAVLKASRPIAPRPVGWTGDGCVIFIGEWTGLGEPYIFVPVSELTVEPAGGGTPVVVCELHGELEQIDWSPDLSHLAIVMDESGKRETTDANGRRTGGWEKRFALKIVDLATKAETDLGSGQCPHWSPDGKRLLYAEPAQAHYIMQNLYVVDAQGGNKRSVAQGRATAPAHIAWSPDSRLVGYSLFPRFDM